MAAKMGNLRPGRPWIIGMDWDGDNATDHFVGNLADIRLYDRALTREQVAELALDFASTCRVPSAGYPSLASGVGDPTCDIVAVGPGAFAVTELAPEHGLILRGSGAGATTLTDGGGDGPLLLLENNIELEALSITGIDRDVDGPVLQIGAQSRTALAGMAFQNNRGRAGGVIMNLGRLLIRDTLFENNKADSRGGAIFNYGAGAPGPTELHVEDSVFSGNSAVSGGVLYSDAAQDTFIRSDFLDNASSSAGGALYAYFNTLAVTDSVFENNASQGGAGALHIDYGQVTISNSQINKNSASADGGAIRMTGDDARLEIRGTSFSGNSARFSGGAIDATAGRLDIATSTFSGNQAGDLATLAAPASTLSLYDAQAHVENSTFSGNQTLPGLIPVQATIRMGGDSDLTLVHSMVADNDPGGEPGIFGLFAFGRSLQVHNTIFARNGSKNCDVRQIEPDEIAFAGSLADDGSCGDAAVSDALFLQPLADNGGPTQTQAITEESAAHKTANPDFCLPSDQRGAARDLAACDVGAYEVVVEEVLRLYLPVIIR